MEKHSSPERDSFIFYRSFYEAIRDIPSKDIKLEVLTALIEYALFGRLPEDLKPFANAMFALIKPIIDKNNKRSENGKKGGRKKKTQTKPYSLTFEQEIQNMKDDKEFSGQICKEFSFSQAQYVSTLDQFLNFIRHYKKDKPHDSLDDARSHLRYWIQKSNALKNNQPADEPLDYTYKGGFGSQDL